MNILFLTLVQFDSVKESGIYTDLLREFVKSGHYVYVVSPIEKRQKKSTYVVDEKHVEIVRLQIGNMQKTNIIEKGISTILIESQYKNAIKKYFSDVKFDMILYSTPPITLVGAIEYVKRRDNAKTYLLLKDIFPQNAIDIGMMKKTGIKGVLYKYFRKQEKKLYSISDKIGCMSWANVEYVLEHNREVKDRNAISLKQCGKPLVELCPNCIEPVDMSITIEERKKLRGKYDIPQDAIVFVYGGNLGKPQGISYMMECLKLQKNNEQVYFLIIGNGTEYHLIEKFIENNKPKNIKLYQALPKKEYDQLVAACDVGMIFLDYRFTIPNFPSRLLSYMQAKLPIFAITDVNTDVGNVIVGIDRNSKKTHEPFGWWCESNNVEDFQLIMSQIISEDLKVMGQRAYLYLLKNYSAKYCSKIIIEKE